MSNSVSPVSLKNDGEALVIQWSDGVMHRLPWKLLRDSCPCATCRMQHSAPPAPAAPPAPKPLLSVLSLAEARPLAPVSVRPVGNYAYSIAFSDGHNTGIYPLELLRELGERANSP